MRILMGICGSIAAYKTPELARRLQEKGITVQIVMTRSAKKFVSPLTLQSLTGKAVREKLFDSVEEQNMDHISLARWANLILVAPATANFIAKLAYGFADDLLTTLCLASQAKILVAPAMNPTMWENEVTQKNVQLLEARGVSILPPEFGINACGEIGIGRLLEVKDIVESVDNIQSGEIEGIAHKNILITAGPTLEDLDPVRFLSNRSSGKMGFAIAKACVANGANVTLISGPVNLSTPEKVTRIDTRSTKDMRTAVLHHLDNIDIFIATAAVADYRPVKRSNNKLKKLGMNAIIELIKNPDILANVAKTKNPPFTVGFAAETEKVAKNALKKLKEKSIDLIAANQVGHSKGGFDQDFNALTVHWLDGKKELSFKSKDKLAIELLRLIAKRYPLKISQ